MGAGYIARKTIRIGLLILVAWFLIHTLVISIDGLQEFSGKADVAIVLGTALYKDGTLTPMLKGRVDKALKLYRDQQVRILFLSGADAEKGYPAQAHGMRSYLLQNGVDSMDIIVDSLGANSYYTAKNFIRLNEKYSFSSAVVVSSFYHVTRCKYILKKLGFKNVESDHSEAFFFQQDISNLVREFLAFYQYVFVY